MTSGSCCHSIKALSLVLSFSRRKKARKNAVHDGLQPNDTAIVYCKTPSQTPKLLLVTKMFCAASGLNVSQVGADASICLLAYGSSSLANSIFLMLRIKNIEEKGLCQCIDVEYS